MPEHPGFGTTSGVTGKVLGICGNGVGFSGFAFSPGEGKEKEREKRGGGGGVIWFLWFFTLRPGGERREDGFVWVYFLLALCSSRVGISYDVIR